MCQVIHGCHLVSDNILQQVSTASRVGNLLLKISVQIQLVSFILQQRIYEHTNYINLELHYTGLTFRHRASCILGQAFHYSPENAFYIFNQQIYFII